MKLFGIIRCTWLDDNFQPARFISLIFLNLAMADTTGMMGKTTTQSTEQQKAVGMRKNGLNKSLLSPPSFFHYTTRRIISPHTPQPPSLTNCLNQAKIGTARGPPVAPWRA